MPTLRRMPTMRTCVRATKPVIPETHLNPKPNNQIHPGLCVYLGRRPNLLESPPHLQLWLAGINGRSSGCPPIPRSSGRLRNQVGWSVQPQQLGVLNLFKLRGTTLDPHSALKAVNFLLPPECEYRLASSVMPSSNGMVKRDMAH